MSRPAARRQAAALKRLPMDAPEDDDDSEQFDWMDAEAEDDEPAEQGEQK